jgi:hypothetical protein
MPADSFADWLALNAGDDPTVGGPTAALAY